MFLYIAFPAFVAWYLLTHVCDVLLETDTRLQAWYAAFYDAVLPDWDSALFTLRRALFMLSTGWLVVWVVLVAQVLYDVARFCLNRIRSARF
jgi:hypothetical protein